MSDTGLFITVKGTEETVRGLDKRKTAIRKSTIQSLRRASEVVLRRAAENVSGKVLNVDRGALRQRLSYNIFADEGISKVGSPVKYAAIHEFGGTVQNPGGTAYFLADKEGRIVFVSNDDARRATGGTFPRTKPHPITIPARPWLQPALSDSRKDIQAIFARGAQEALDDLGAAPA